MSCSASSSVAFVKGTMKRLEMSSDKQGLYMCLTVSLKRKVTMRVFVMICGPSEGVLRPGWNKAPAYLLRIALVRPIGRTMNGSRRKCQVLSPFPFGSFPANPLLMRGELVP